MCCHLFRQMPQNWLELCQSHRSVLVWSAPVLSQCPHSHLPHQVQNCLRTMTFLPRNIPCSLHRCFLWEENAWFTTPDKSSNISRSELFYCAYSYRSDNRVGYLERFCAAHIKQAYSQVSGPPCNQRCLLEKEGGES